MIFSCKKNCGGIDFPALPERAIYLEARFSGNVSKYYSGWKWSCKQRIKKGKSPDEVKEIDLSKIREPGHYEKNLVILAESNVDTEYTYEFTVVGT